MPKQYTAMRDKFVKEGLSYDKAQAKAAAIYNSKHKGHPVGNNKHYADGGVVYDYNDQTIGAFPDIGSDGPMVTGGSKAVEPYTFFTGTGSLLEGLRGAWPKSTNIEDRRFDGPYHGVNNRVQGDYYEWMLQHPLSNYEETNPGATKTESYNNRLRDFLEMDRRAGAAKMPGRLKRPGSGFPWEDQEKPPIPREKPKKGQKKKMKPPIPREKPEMHGRYGDNTMMHVSNDELNMLNEMVPGGLSTNPETGYAEAFDLWPVLAGLAIGGLGAMFLPALLPAGAAALGLGGAEAAAGAGSLAGLGAIGAGEAGLASGLAGAGALAPMAADASIMGLGAVGGAGAASAMAAPAWSLGGMAGGVGNWMMNNPLPTLMIGNGLYSAFTAPGTPKPKKDKSKPLPEQVMLRDRYLSNEDGSMNNFGNPYYVDAADYYGSAWGYKDGGVVGCYADGGMVNQPQGLGSLQSTGSEDATRAFDRELVQGAIHALTGQSSDPEGDIGRFLERFGRAALADLANKVGGEGQAPGRMIKGPGTGRSDSIPAVVSDNGQPIKVSNGEFIMPKHAVDKYGADTLYAMAQP